MASNPNPSGLALASMSVKKLESVSRKLEAIRREAQKTTATAKVA
jgi:hypothetical protein